MVAEPEHRGWRCPPHYTGNGCTMAPDKLFGVDLTPACRLHDFQCYYGIVARPEADAIFRSYLKELGLPSWAATVYWIAVKLARPLFNETHELPARWKPYAMQLDQSDYYQ